MNYNSPIVQTVGGGATEAMYADVALVERIVARDESALAKLYDRHSRLLFGLMLRILRDRGEAEEVLQEVFMALWSRADTYSAALGSPAAWLVSIARNRCIDRLRSRSVRTRVLESVEEPPAADNPESHAVRSEQQEAIRSALVTLPVEQRELIEYAYFLGLTQSELAARFGLPLGTVKTRVRTGLGALRERLSGYE
jgi:RNA polymerase sigma-70 factor (ECF subfamily)